MRILDVPMRLAQRWLGTGRMPYVFLLPNLVFFGTFVIVPLFINFAYSISGGTEFYLENRPLVGAEQYGYLFDCDNALDVSGTRRTACRPGVTAG